MTRLNLTSDSEQHQNDAMMTNIQYQTLRKSVELTRPRLAEILGVSVSTILKREIGKTKITNEAALALRSVVAIRLEMGFGQTTTAEVTQ